MTLAQRKQMVQDWLDHPAWELIKNELLTETDALIQKMIDDNGEALQIRADIRARQSLLNKLEKYDG